MPDDASSASRPEQADPSTAGLSAQTPWRCAECHYDVHVHSLGDRCPECGTVLDERSYRPIWTYETNLERMRGWATVALFANLLPLVATVLFIGLVIIGAASGVGSPLGPVLLVYAGHVFGHLFASLGIANTGVGPIRAKIIRVIGIVRLVAFITGHVAFCAWILTALSGGVVFVWPTAMFTFLGVGIGCDIALGRIVAGFAGEVEVRLPVWHRAAQHAATLVLALSFLLLFAPSVGPLAPLLWYAANAVCFACLRRAIRRAKLDLQDSADQ